MRYFSDNKLKLSPIPMVMSTVTVALIATWVVKRYSHHNASPIGNMWSSKIISFLMRRTPQFKLYSNTVRKSFLTSANIISPDLPLSNNHSHPIACVARNVSVLQMVHISREIGLQPYLVQMSSADLKTDYDGCRSYHWSKDLSVPPADFNPPDGCAVIIVDTDMYIDMPRTMAMFPRTYLISTFQPTKVADKGDNYDFTFDKDNNVTYSVSGGANYFHKVWNYAHDDLLVNVEGDMLGLGIWWKTVVYSIERRQYDSHHQIILLVPSRIIHSPLISISRWLKGNELSRLHIGVSKNNMDFLRMDIVTKTGRFRSTGIAGSYQSATVKAEEDDTLASQSRVSTINISPHQVATTLNIHDVGVCSILTEFHRMKISYTPQSVTPMDQSINRYQFYPREYNPDAPHMLKPFMNPIIGGMYSPDATASNEARAVNGRVKEIKNEFIPMTNELTRYINEFAELLVPVSGILHPKDIDTVYDKQHRPSQRAIVNRALLNSNLMDEDKPIESFLKAEPYDGPKDPRIISTIPGKTKISYSAYTYAFAELLRTQRWYAFGKTPIQIAQRVGDIALKANVIHNTDYARFDGRVSNICRSLERIVMLRAFHEAYHADLAELLLTQYGQRAVTKNGVKYTTDYTRASGSPETADFNSEDNAFIAYITLRRTMVNGEFLTPDQAWGALGIYGGDDGVTADVNPELYKRSANDLGHLLEVESVNRHELGVTFLSRYYSPYVWEGGLDSICDLRRQLVKLHTTVALPPHISPLEKLGEKLSGYGLTDYNTPILGTIIQTFELVYPEYYKNGIQDAHSKYLVANFNNNFVSSEQYPNQDICYWMGMYTEKWFKAFDNDLFFSFINQVKNGNVNILSMPQCEPSTSLHFGKLPVVINGEYNTPCKYGILCRATNCIYEHSCRFHSSCASTNCNLFHHEAPIFTKDLREVAIVDNSIKQKTMTDDGEIDRKWCLYDDQYCRKLKSGNCPLKHRAHTTAEGKVEKLKGPAKRGPKSKRP